VNAPLAKPAHSPFGGSVATRVLHCPASVGLVAKVPENLRRSSTYADRGTALHVAMTLLLDETETLESLVGKTINSYTITSDDVENALRPVLAYVDALLDQPGAEYFPERHVVLPDVFGAFGTGDLFVHIGDTTHVVDYKFGPAVRVLALHPDGDEDVINPQPLFYAAGGCYSIPEFFAGVDNIVLTILQPQSIEPDSEMVSTVQVTRAEVNEFVAVYRAACEEALSPSPRLERGDHCRFCPAKPICPAHVGPLLDFAQLVVPTAPPAAAAGAATKQTYLQVLADGLDLVNAIKGVGTTLRDQATAALQNGDVVPGYTLSAGRAERHWRDDEPTAIAALQSLGLSREDIIAETMRSVKQIEIRAKARGLKVPSEFIVSTRSGTSLTRVENAHDPVPRRGEIVRSFTEALTAFQKGSDHDD
jgi:hypothetical protein